MKDEKGNMDNEAENNDWQYLLQERRGKEQEVQKKKSCLDKEHSLNTKCVIKGSHQGKFQVLVDGHMHSCHPWIFAR